jgi:Tfp pilus assembly protein PilO
MATPKSFNYKTESNRYNYYYRRLQIFYQKPVTKVSTAVLFSLTTILFFAIFAIRPTLITIGELLKKIENQKVVLTKAENKVAALATAQELYDQISPDLPVLESAVPVEYQVQQLLLHLEAVAGNLGVPINNLSLSKLVYPPDPKAANSSHEIDFTVSFDASYPNAKLLVANLDQLPRLISLNSISFTKPTDASHDPSASTDTITINLNCQTYYYPESTN